MHRHIPVEVHDQGIAGDLHGVDLQVVEREVVAGGLGGFGEKLADEVGGIDLHLLGELAAEEGNEEEVELLVVAEVLDAGVAEADGLALRVGDDRDVRLGIEADAEAGTTHFGTQFGVGFDVNQDAFVLKADLRVLRVSITATVTSAAEVVAAIGRAEELLVERALERLRGDADLNGAGGQCERQGQDREKAAEDARGIHLSSITGTGGERSRDGQIWDASECRAKR